MDPSGRTGGPMSFAASSRSSVIRI
jgi:hypothetical protein